MNFVEAMTAAQAGYDTWAAKPHNKKWAKMIYHTPIPNDLAVCIAEAVAAATLTARSAPEAGKAVVKPLVWEAREKPDLNGNRYWRAQTTFDWGYRIYFEDSRYVIQGGDKDFATLDEAKAAAQADYEQRILSALASSPAPTGAEPAWGPAVRAATRESHASIYDIGAQQPVAPTGEIAGLVERLDSHMGMQDVSILLRDCRLAAAALTASEAEAADLRRKLEEHQDAEDKAAREMATVIQGLRNRATAAERKLEEARTALRHIANHTSMLDELENCMEMRRIAARALSAQVEERE